ncbi:hypothetical protein Taro_021764, partial [Colocasia esculenta]|nr:hypothetical protein [Colocasia esculenta]
VQTLFAKVVSTHPTMVSTQYLRLKGKKNGTAGRRRMRADRHWITSQNSLFSDLGQEVDPTTRAGRHTTERLQLKMDDCHKQLKCLKEADQVEASVGEDFKEDPQFKSAEHRLGLQESKLLPNLSFYKGVHLKNKVRCTVLEGRLLEDLLSSLSPVGDGTAVVCSPISVLGEEPSAGVPLSPEGRHLDGRLVPAQGPHHQLHIQHLAGPQAEEEEVAVKQRSALHHRWVRTVLLPHIGSPNDL